MNNVDSAVDEALDILRALAGEAEDLLNELQDGVQFEFVWGKTEQTDEGTVLPLRVRMIVEE